MRTIHLVRRLPNGSTFRFGTATQTENGWRFIPNLASRKSSRKFHPTLEKCIPRWAAKADHEEVTR